MIGATEKQQPNRNQSGLEKDMTPEEHQLPSGRELQASTSPSRITPALELWLMQSPIFSDCCGSNPTAIPRRPEDPGTSRFPGLLEDEIFIITRSCDTAIYL
jgi:hypothetical protein